MQGTDVELARQAFVRIAYDVLRTESSLPTERRLAELELGNPTDKARIKLSGTSGYDFDDRRALTKSLVYHVVLEALDERVLQLFESVRFFMPNDVLIRPLTDEITWREALRIIVHHNIGNWPPAEFLEQRQFRDAPIAYAAKRLRQRGFAIEIAGAEFHIDESEASRLWRFIAVQTTARPNRERLLTLIFRNISTHWRPAIGRYVISRLLGTTPIKHEPSIPWNYVLQLAARAWANDLFVGNSTTALSDEDLIAFLTDVVAIFDVEPYSIHELMFPNPNRYLELLTGLAQFQAAIDLPQRPASDLVPLIRALFCWLPGSVEESRLAFTLDNLVAFAEAFLAATAGRQGPSMLRRSDIESRVSAAIPSTALSTLWEATVHDRGTVNVAFASPLDWRSATFVTKPFVSQGGEYIGLADQALGVESFLIAALKAVNSAIPGANDRVGRTGFETYVRQLLSAGGCSVIAGKYGQTGEIDALVETTDAIILIECKKRMLGADALAGNRDEVTREMVLTVARGHEQLLRAECELLQTGRLVIDGTSVYLSGREIFRIVVSLHDWGVLHDQQIVRYALTSLLSIQFGHHAIQDPAINEWITEVNDVTADLRKSITCIVGLRPERARQPFWNALFLPVGVLNLMLERRGDVVRLARRLGTRSRLITGNLDAYADFEHLGGI